MKVCIFFDGGLKSPCYFISFASMDERYYKALNEKVNKRRDDMLLNRFANEFYQHLRPSKLMTTNDIAQFIIDFLDKKTDRNI